MMMVHMARDIMERTTQAGKYAAWSCLAWSCACVATAPPPPSTFVVEQSFADSRPQAIGLSGLGRAPDGTLWAVPERRRELYALEPASPGGFVARTVPLVGVPDNSDTEALVVLGDGTFVLGTERHVERDSDAVLLAKLEGSAVRVTDEIP